MTKTTKGLYLGRPEAEAESTNATSSLKDFFEDFLDIETNIRSGAFIISGRKGAGKSAYATWLNSCNNSIISSSIVKRNDFDLDAMVNQISSDKIKFEAFFEWIILVRFVKLIVDSKCGTYIKQVQALSIFMKKNSGYVDIDKYVISEILENKEVNFAPLNGQFGFFTKLFGYKKTKAPFYQMISPLRETIQQVLSMEIFSNYTFYVLFDDLDVKFHLTNIQDRVMLMDLIRIAKRYNTEYLGKTKSRVLLFVRDDICDRLEGVDCDRNKIFESYEYRINWFQYTDSKQSEQNSMLRQLINKRIRCAFEQRKWKYDERDPWHSFINEVDNDGKSQFKYILDHTFYLPRDIISIFAKVGQKNFCIPLKKEDVNTLLKEFAIVKKSEIVDELQTLYNSDTIELIFSVLEEVCKKWDATYEQILEIINVKGLDIKVFSDLLEYSLLIPVDQQGHLYFSYREKVPTKDYSLYTFRTHKILNLYFRNR